MNNDLRLKENVIKTLGILKITTINVKDTNRYRNNILLPYKLIKKMRSFIDYCEVDKERKDKILSNYIVNRTLTLSIKNMSNIENNIIDYNKRSYRKLKNVSVYQQIADIIIKSKENDIIDEKSYINYIIQILLDNYTKQSRLSSLY